MTEIVLGVFAVALLLFVLIFIVHRVKARPGHSPPAPPASAPPGVPLPLSVVAAISPETVFELWDDRLGPERRQGWRRNIPTAATVLATALLSLREAGALDFQLEAHRRLFGRSTERLLVRATGKGADAGIEQEFLRVQPRSPSDAWEWVSAWFGGSRLFPDDDVLRAAAAWGLAYGLFDRFERASPEFLRSLFGPPPPVYRLRPGALESIAKDVWALRSMWDRFLTAEPQQAELLVVQTMGVISSLDYSARNV